jgi:hypothetical protein
MAKFKLPLTKNCLFGALCQRKKTQYPNSFSTANLVDNTLVNSSEKGKTCFHNYHSRHGLNSYRQAQTYDTILCPFLNVMWLPPTSDTILRPFLNVLWLPLTSDTILRPFLNVLWLPLTSNTIKRPFLNVLWLPPTSNTTILRPFLNVLWLPLTSDTVSSARFCRGCP